MSKETLCPYCGKSSVFVDVISFMEIQISSQSHNVKMPGKECQECGVEIFTRESIAKLEMN